jgi:hypothetical protein
MTALPALADGTDPCSEFSWNVAQERALFASPAAGLTMGAGTDPAPLLVTNELYSVRLQPRSSVNFTVLPSKRMPVEAGYAGQFSLQIPAAGVYRISGDSAFWIDVVVAGKIIDSKDYQGQKGCTAPHKIVEFTLPAAVPIVLEVSSVLSQDIRLAITAAP